jgi:hypothetical protein
MVKQKWFQKLELSNRVISTPGCLLAFFSKDADSYMSCKDHSNIIGTVSDGQSRLTWMIFSYQSHNVSFLLWTDTTGKDNIYLICDFQECRFQMLICINSYERGTSND